jgi:hypothetical protein
VKEAQAVTVWISQSSLSPEPWHALWQQVNGDVIHAEQTTEAVNVVRFEIDDHVLVVRADAARSTQNVEPPSGHPKRR